jgi:hypothetical protein
LSKILFGLLFGEDLVKLLLSLKLVIPKISAEHFARLPAHKGSLPVALIVIPITLIHLFFCLVVEATLSHSFVLNELSHVDSRLGLEAPQAKALVVLPGSFIDIPLRIVDELAKAFSHEFSLLPEIDVTVRIEDRSISLANALLKITLKDIASDMHQSSQTLKSVILERPDIKLQNLEHI